MFLFVTLLLIRYLVLLFSLPFFMDIFCKLHIYYWEGLFSSGMGNSVIKPGYIIGQTFNSVSPLFILWITLRLLFSKLHIISCRSNSIIPI